MHKEPTSKGSLVSLTDGTLTEERARSMLEGIRWPDSPRCLFSDCGGADVYRITVKGGTMKSGRIVGPRHLFKCKACRRQFSVTKGTIFEDSKIPLRTWITVMYRMCSSKKGVSAHQIHREFGIGYESAWFMCHRIRYAMEDKNPTALTGVIEADETYVGGKLRGHRKDRIKKNTMSDSVRQGLAKKTAVFGIRERGGRVRAQAMPMLSQRDVERHLAENIDLGNSHLITDEHPLYYWIRRYLPHDVIRHRSEYVRGPVHTQGIESFWALLKAWADRDVSSR